jgi:hypothetical protein
MTQKTQFNRLLWAAAVALCSLASTSAMATATDRQWINGRWFDGENFVAKTVYSVAGRLTLHKPAVDLPVEDLMGRFVVPPYGDAHHHGIDGETDLDKKIAAFLKQGIFYVKNPNVIPGYLKDSVRGRLNRPDSIDVVFANGGLTGSGGHPGPLHAWLASKGVFKGMAAADMEGRAYFNIDSLAELDAKWPAIAAAKPDFIKTFLNGHHRLISAAEAGTEIKSKTDHHSGESGLAPEVLRALVKKAHRQGLRVSTHADTAADFRVAVDAGVDEMAHMPLGNPLLPGAIEASLISPDDARAAARRRVTVVATANVKHRFHGSKWDSMDHARLVASQRANLRMLRDAGVPIAIGSDGISGEEPFVTALDEARYLKQRDLVSNLALLQMWTQTTAATIFPKRRIGRLDEGFEANFLVLDGNPIEDFANFQRIHLRVKAGEPILLR